MIFWQAEAIANQFNPTMDIDPQYFEERKEQARQLYDSKQVIHNPYLNCEVVLNAKGFHHLQFSAGRERNKKEQLLKFRLLPLALETIRHAGTLQEYRRMLQPVDGPSARGETRLKQVEYWGFVAILGHRERPIKLRTILRRIGDGNVTFWSVMPYNKFRRGEQRLSADDIEDN
jgi:hypothetical protein